jgi:hypothetical protein
MPDQVLTTALSFEAGALQAENFDPEVFSKELRAQIPLDTLRRDLDAHLQMLKGTLVDLINRDYNDLVNMSTNLVGIDKQVAESSQPLGVLREQVISAQADAIESASELRGLYDTRSSVATKRTTLQLFLQIADSLASITRLWVSFGIASTKYGSSEDTELAGEAGAGGDAALQPPLHYLGRIAAELHLQQLACARCPDTYAFVLQSKQALQVHEDNLLKELSIRLRSSITNRDCISTTILLQAYATIHRESAAEELYQHTFVVPFLTEAVKASSSADSATVGLKDLDVLFSEVIRFIAEVPTSDLLQISSKIHADILGPGDFDFISNSVWTAVFEVSKDRMYQPASSAFQLNYCQTMTFIDRLENSFETLSDINKFRLHPTTQTFDDKWKVHLKTYFQIYKNDTIRTAEDCLSSTLAPNSHHESSGFAFIASRTMWSLVLRCWDTDVFILPLGHEFLKLSLQLTARYRSWISDGLNEIEGRCHASADGLESSDKLTDAANQSVGNAMPDSWATLPSDDYILMYADAQLFLQRVRSELPGVTLVRPFNMYIDSIATKSDWMCIAFAEC